MFVVNKEKGKCTIKYILLTHPVIQRATGYRERIIGSLALIIINYLIKRVTQFPLSFSSTCLLTMKSSHLDLRHIKLTLSWSGKVLDILIL